MSPASESRAFVMTRFGWALLTRALPGIAAIAAASEGRAVIAGVLLTVAAAADVVVDSIADGREWRRGASETQIEGFVDFVCFIWAPLAFVWSIGRPAWLWLPGAIFVLAGTFRLARFNVEGMVNGGYRGLPVTYNALFLPAAHLCVSPLGPRTATAIVAMVLLVSAALMVSSRFVTPRISW